MKAKSLYTYETRINGLDKEPFYLITKNSCYWNLYLDKTEDFPERKITIETGKVSKTSNDFYQFVLNNFKKLNIKNLDSVIVICDNIGNIIAITSKKQDLYIDVNNKFNLKSLMDFNILITSIRFY